MQVYNIRLDENTWKKSKMIDRDGIEKKGKKEIKVEKKLRKSGKN